LPLLVIIVCVIKFKYQLPLKWIVTGVIFIYFLLLIGVIGLEQVFFILLNKSISAKFPNLLEYTLVSASEILVITLYVAVVDKYHLYIYDGSKNTRSKELEFILAALS
jgi:hypothetical protein